MSASTVAVVSGVLSTALIILGWWVFVLLAENTALKKKNGTQAELLLHNGLEIEHLKKKLEKIRELI